MIVVAGQPALVQSPVAVTNTPGVSVENTPGVVLTNAPGVTVENDSESPVAVSVSDTVDSKPQALLEYRAVGYTATRSSGTIDADSSAGTKVGFAAMHELCQQQVSGAARAAFSHEALLPAAPLFGQVDMTWIIPSALIYSYNDAGAIDRVFCHWYGADARNSDEEEIGYATGLAFYPFSGRIRAVFRETALPIAYSAPVMVICFSPIDDRSR